MKLLENGLEAECMVFMVQKEVARRMMAEPGGKDYGALTVAVRYYSAPSIIMDVPPDCFIPQPDVDSSVIRLDLYKTPPVELKDKDPILQSRKSGVRTEKKDTGKRIEQCGLYRCRQGADPDTARENRHR